MDLETKIIVWMTGKLELPAGGTMCSTMETVVALNSDEVGRMTGPFRMGASERRSIRIVELAPLIWHSTTK